MFSIKLAKKKNNQTKNIYKKRSMSKRSLLSRQVGEKSVRCVWLHCSFGTQPMGLDRQMVVLALVTFWTVLLGVLHCSLLIRFLCWLWLVDCSELDLEFQHPSDWFLSLSKLSPVSSEQSAIFCSNSVGSDLYFFVQLVPWPISAFHQRLAVSCVQHHL